MELPAFSTNLCDDLPQIDPRRFIPKRYLQAHAIRFFENGLDRRLNDSAAREFDQHTVADVVFRHGCGILHPMPGERPKD